MNNILLNRQTGEYIELPRFSKSGNGRILKPELFKTEREKKLKNRNISYGSPSQGAYSKAYDDLKKWLDQTLPDVKHKRINYQQYQEYIGSEGYFSINATPEPTVIMSTLTERYGPIIVEANQSSVTFRLPSWVIAGTQSNPETSIRQFQYGGYRYGQRYEAYAFPTFRRTYYAEWSTHFMPGDLVEPVKHVLLHLRSNKMIDGTVGATERKIIEEIIKEFETKESLYASHDNRNEKLKELVECFDTKNFIHTNRAWEIKFGGDNIVPLRGEERVVLAEAIEMLSHVRRNNLMASVKTAYVYDPETKKYGHVPQNVELHYTPNGEVIDGQTAHKHILKFDLISGRAIIKCGYESDMEAYQQWQISQAVDFLKELAPTGEQAKEQWFEYEPEGTNE